jgi:crossover junction endodeoxyribonuclease RuvC
MRAAGVETAGEGVPVARPAVAPATPCRVVGFDPGLDVTGYGVVECGRDGVRLIEAGTVRSRGTSIEDRLVTIHSGVREVIDELRPHAMAVEQLFVHSRYPRTAILMGHARGVICLAAAQASLVVTHYPPARVKRLLTGSGRADKGQMQRAVQRELGLPALPEPADAADALAVAITDWHLRLRLSPAAAALGGTRRR